MSADPENTREERRQTNTVSFCGYTINGPKVGRHVVAWRKQCRRKVRGGGRCWQHVVEPRRG